MKIQPTVQKPQSVKNATNLLLISLIIGLFSAVYNFLVSPGLAQFLKPTENIKISILVLITTLIFFLFLIWKIYSGRNWARITYLILYVLGTPFYLLGLSALFLISPINGLVSILQTSLQLIALFQLFTKTATKWFFSVKSNTKNDIDFRNIVYASNSHQELGSVTSTAKIDDFIKITELYKQGFITDEEYQKQKQKYGLA